MLKPRLCCNYILKRYSGKLTISSYSKTTTTEITPVSPVDSKPETLVRKWSAFWKALVNDYKDVFLESIKQMKENPKKSLLYFSLFGCGIVCCMTNPNETSHRENVIECCNQMILIGSPIRNPTSDNYLRSMERYYNQGLLQQISFGLFSILLLKHKNKDTALFKENCSYLQPSYLAVIQENILDIGFFGKWWSLDKMMNDYDINPNEWM